MNQNSFGIENQCELSYELLYLLKWLFEHDEALLKKIVVQALDNGLRQELAQRDRQLHTEQAESIQNSIVDFLDLLDDLLHEAMNETSIKQALEKSLMPSINKIDYNVCDRATVECSLEKTSHHLEHEPQANAKEFLFKEILKRWKPLKKKMHC
ncbi:MAG: hypothetical protein AB7R69_03610 [Candidatus Babeliales bacterium]